MGDSIIVAADVRRRNWAVNGIPFSRRRIQLSQANFGAGFGNGNVRSREINQSALQERIFAIVGRQQALPLADKSFFAQVLPFGFASESERTIGRTFGTNIASGNMAGSLPAIRPHELRWNPNQIPKVRRFRQRNPLDAAKRNPIILALEN